METHQAYELVRAYLLRTCLIAEVSKNVTDDPKLAFDHRGLKGLYPRSNGWNSYAPTRPLLVSQCSAQTGRVVTYGPEHNSAEDIFLEKKVEKNVKK